MSCDFGVWFPSKHLTNEEADELYAQLCEGEIDGITPHSSIDSFYKEITSKHPEIDDIPDDDVDDLDLCPWSIAFDRSDGHLLISCVWSKAEYVESLIKELAKKHGLAVYDPQTETIIYPN